MYGSAAHDSWRLGRCIFKIITQEARYSSPPTHQLIEVLSSSMCVLSWFWERGQFHMMTGVQFGMITDRCETALYLTDVQVYIT